VEPEDTAIRAQQRVLGHREMASRALLALIRNSVQHAPPGSLVRLSVIETKDTCAIIVTDDGTPLSEQAKESAFTAAGQISTKSIRGGRYSRGLGLYCARVCAEAAGANASFYQEAKPANAFALSLVLDR
jgi:K+-sensing histidine kinase KdpD